MAETNLKDLKVRLGVSFLVGLLCVVTIGLATHPIFSLLFVGFAGALMATALYEYYKLVEKKGVSPSLSLGITFGILYLIASYFHALSPQFLSKPLVFSLPDCILGLAFFACFAFFALRQKSALLHISTTFFGIIYIAIPFGLIVRIPYLFGKESWEGIFWLAFLLAVTKSADVGAYFVGRLFGKRKLALKLSPNKTLEGAIAGLISSSVVSVIFLYFASTSPTFTMKMGLIASAILGFAIGLLGELGDLAESLLKRDAVVKDSNTIPGIGGVLDMVDSLLFTAPLLYIFLKIYPYYSI